MMREIFIIPFLLGLSTGVYCLAYCIPFVAPVMVFEPREKKKDFSVISKFILGRFFGYLVFGAVFGYLGQRIDNVNINLMMFIALMILSLVLILQGIGLIGAKKFSVCAKIKKFNPKLPILMGFLMGINICPPFLMSLGYVFSLHSAVKGVLYFLMFFIGTSLYFLPLFFLGYLNKIKEFQVVGRISALIIGSFFLLYGLYYIL